MIKINLRQILWDKNITAVSVHRATGISQSIISEIIHNKRVNVGLDIINKLCIFLKCDLYELLEFVPEKDIAERKIPSHSSKRKLGNTVK